MRDQRRQQLDGLAAIVAQQLRDDRSPALCGAIATLAVGTVLRAQPHIDQAQEVIDLGQRRHRALEPAAAGALLDRHRGRNAVNGIQIGPRRRLHELARIGVERFQVAALALVEQDVEGQSGFARAGHAGDDGKALARNLDVDVLEVVLARAAHDDAAVTAALGHRRPAGGSAHCCDGGGRARLAYRSQRAPGVRALRTSACCMSRSGVRGGHQLAAALAALRSQIDDPVGGADDVEVVLDHQQRMAGLEQQPEGVHQARDVLEMQAGGGLIEDQQFAAPGCGLACLALRARCRRVPLPPGGRRASAAALRRPTRSAPAGRGARSPGRRPPAAAAARTRPR